MGGDAARHEETSSSGSAPGGRQVPSAAIANVFAQREPIGVAYPSPYTDRVATVVLRSGAAETGRWFQERRDVAADYRLLFEGDPPPVTGVQILTDSDDAGGTASARYDRVAFQAD